MGMNQKWTRNDTREFNENSGSFLRFLEILRIPPGISRGE
jgi:hypothetical protein